jgi:16S rRNA (guanine966-N2)-methyltransferase
MIRIIGGRWKGQYLKVPDGKGTRPTSAARRESLFNILEHGLGHQSEKVLDLFAGTGSLAFEALSRGAHRALLIEKDSDALDVLQKNLAILQLSPQEVTVLASHKFKEWPEKVARLAEFLPLDTIFCDPPYEMGLIEKVLPKFEAKSEIFAPHAILVAEMEDDGEVPQLPGWSFIKDRSHGEGRLLFYRRAANSNQA